MAFYIRSNRDSPLDAHEALLGGLQAHLAKHVFGDRFDVIQVNKIRHGLLVIERSVLRHRIHHVQFVETGADRGSHGEDIVQFAQGVIEGVGTRRLFRLSGSRIPQHRQSPLEGSEQVRIHVRGLVHRDAVTVRRDQPSAKQRRREARDAEIKVLFEAGKSRNGAIRLAKDMTALDMKCNRKTVADSLRRQGLRAKAAKKFKASTHSKHNVPVAANLLQQDFTADAPNQKWIVDITYLWTDEGWLYLATMMDLCRLVDVRAHDSGAGVRRSGDGAMAAQKAQKRHCTLRPGWPSIARRTIRL